ncbi:MAG: 4-(cytidine 5'-diphospho)-2-C-methyl-D-erythritol kinase [Prevotellaceae bacterium]|jgi:4-diphosphocytidyl-2-C-methyl-D-erythritol kinase|nr:4-(cytidine 5'-diphospho)-2-C-methyl-D-erythritol kinase [Prevotellaceae bacterium]
MIVFPNAKINLGLNVTAKRNDGFHNIETVFYPVNLCDILEIVKSQNAASMLFNSGIIINDDTNNNLCIKALSLMKKDFPIPEVDIFLHKNIPFGAGLGGGSADAANVLTVLNEMFNLNISDEKLLQYAAELGSDCAFFIKNKPQLASGRGEVLTDINVDLSGYYLVLIKPDLFVATAYAYANIKPQQPEIKVSEIIAKPVEEWKYFLKNDFENVIFEKFPQIKMIKETLYSRGAIYASMSGSGSSVYGIFNNAVDTSDFEKDYFVFTERFTNGKSVKF